MKFDILKHKLVPHHEILSQEEVEKLLKTYNIKKEQLPRMLLSDPVAKAIGAKEGDIVKIIRKGVEEIITEEDLNYLINVWEGDYVITETLEIL